MPPQSEDAPKHWLQEYQEYVLSLLGNSSGPRKASASGKASSSFRLIPWASGEKNWLTFANGAYLILFSGSPFNVVVFEVTIITIPIQNLICGILARAITPGTDCGTRKIRVETILNRV